MDFDDLIMNLVRTADPDLDLRLESQAAALKELECTNTLLGRWIDEYDVEYLMAAFNLDDDEFSSDFPALGHLNQHDRSQIMEAFEKHFDQCPHCYLKRGYDLEMNARMERAYSLNSTEVAQFLRSTQDVPAQEMEGAADNAVAGGATKPELVVNVDDLLRAAEASIASGRAHAKAASVTVDDLIQAAATKSARK